jgi:hypothetical protein
MDNKGFELFFLQRAHLRMWKAYFDEKIRNYFYKILGIAKEV